MDARPRYRIVANGWRPYDRRACGSSELRYELPERRHRPEPVEPRDAARLLVALGRGRRPRHVAEFRHCWAGRRTRRERHAGAAGRLQLTKATGGAVEVLLLSPVEPRTPSGRRWCGPASGCPRAPTCSTTGATVGDSRRRRRRRRMSTRDACVGVTKPAEAEAARRPHRASMPLPPYIHEPARRSRAATRPSTPATPGRWRRRRPACISPTRCSRACRAAGADDRGRSPSTSGSARSVR